MGVEGLNTQYGLTFTCWAAQYEPVKLSYAELPSKSTLALPNATLRALH